MRVIIHTILILLYFIYFALFKHASGMIFSFIPALYRNVGYIQEPLRTGAQCALTNCT